MVLGQSAAVAAAIAIDERCPVQDVSYRALRVELDSAGFILERPDDAEVFTVGVTEAEAIAS